MNMKKGNGYLVVLISFLTFTLFIVLFKNTIGQDSLVLTEVDVTSSNMGILEEELTFSTVMEQTSAVVVGEVTGVEKLNDTRLFFL